MPKRQKNLRSWVLSGTSSCPEGTEEISRTQASRRAPRPVQAHPIDAPWKGDGSNGGAAKPWTRIGVSPSPHPGRDEFFGHATGRRARRLACVRLMSGVPPGRCKMSKLQEQAFQPAGRATGKSLEPADKDVRATVRGPNARPLDMEALQEGNTPNPSEFFVHSGAKGVSTRPRQP